MQNISQRVINLLNYRIEQEEYSSRLYKSMAIWLEYNGYLGAAKLWNRYSKEELEHAEWAYEYLLDLDIMPNVPALLKPESEFAGLVDILQRSFDHETLITNQCQNFASESFKDADFMALELAQKYLKEQQEELSKTTKWLDRIEAFGTTNDVLRLLDNELSEEA